jgi:hypothetical protein
VSLPWGPNHSYFLPSKSTKYAAFCGYSKLRHPVAGQNCFAQLFYRCREGRTTDILSSKLINRCKLRIISSLRLFSSKNHQNCCFLRLQFPQTPRCTINCFACSTLLNFFQLYRERVTMINCLTKINNYAVFGATTFSVPRRTPKVISSTLFNLIRQCHEKVAEGTTLLKFRKSCCVFVSAVSSDTPLHAKILLCSTVFQHGCGSV